MSPYAGGATATCPAQRFAWPGFWGWSSPALPATRMSLHRTGPAPACCEPWESCRQTSRLPGWCLTTCIWSSSGPRDRAPRCGSRPSGCDRCRVRLRPMCLEIVLSLLRAPRGSGRFRSCRLRPGGRLPPTFYHRPTMLGAVKDKPSSRQDKPRKGGRDVESETFHRDPEGSTPSRQRPASRKRVLHGRWQHRS